MKPTIILGAGLAGISASYHIGHSSCNIYEKTSDWGGHIRSVTRDGFTWDEGPHVSFTKHAYVQQLFTESVNGHVVNPEFIIRNYYFGSLIPHPAQVNLFAIPQPLRDACLTDFLHTREKPAPISVRSYAEWAEYAFGKTFAENFTFAYTRKYWASDPHQLSTDWIGKRIYYPSISEVKTGYTKPLSYQTHYIERFRYPEQHGYRTFAQKMSRGARITYSSELTAISFKRREITINNSDSITYDRLVSSIPLPVLISLSDAPDEIKHAAKQLQCSSLTLVNIALKNPAKQNYHLVYVYDPDTLSTRITFMDQIAPKNAPIGCSSIQVEVYFSKHKPKILSDAEIEHRVIKELIDMGFIGSQKDVLFSFSQFVPYANVIFDLQTKTNLSRILEWLSTCGLSREPEDTNPFHNWQETNSPKPDTYLFLAGRYGQWKYFWTDDCVLRGKQLAEFMKQ